MPPSDNPVVIERRPSPESGAAPAAARSWLLKELTHATRQEQIRLGHGVWLVDELLRLIEFSARSAADSHGALQTWCESPRLLGLEWYPSWQDHGDQLTISFHPMTPEPNLTPLWWLLQLWHQMLAHHYPAMHWQLLWPQPRHEPAAPLALLQPRYGRQPALHLDNSRWPNPDDQLRPLHGLLGAMLQRLTRLGAQPQGLLEQIKHHIGQALPTPPKLGELARLRQTPPRTLQRQINAYGTSYHQLLEEVRRNQAVSLLSRPHLTTLEIGLRLGYQDAPSFQRAFRKWFAMTPGQYRQRYQAPAVMPPQAAVSLYYAINRIQHHQRHHYDGARVWICLRNLAFAKLVKVLAEDKDGIWRPYRATFERTLTDDLEIWSTSSLPVHDPLRFRIQYRVGGETYLDDNGGHDYCLNGPMLLGPHPAVCHQLISVLGVDGEHRVLVRLFSQDGWRQACVLADGAPTPFPLQGRPCGEAWEWQGLIPTEDPTTALRFEFVADTRPPLLLDNDGAGFLPCPC